MATTSNKRKKAVAATVTAAALLLGGTFAWTSISQQALNESAGIVNVGGRLHDDFNGKNKDVYVENFTDPLKGGQPIYARVKLTEYMEVGQEAGQADNPDRNAIPVVEGTDIKDDPTSWPTHIPAGLTDEESQTCTICNNGSTHTIHDHWKWTMGGETTYMPTFNKDKDSLKADINGTYAGVDGSDKVYYDDYVSYTTDENGKIFDAQTEVLPVDEDVYQKTDIAFYDNDTETDEDEHVFPLQSEDLIAEAETHTAKQTVNAKVITMEEWKTDYHSEQGNYWVYDSDGWAYWAAPIMPGQATGLLLDSIEMTRNPGEKCYYAIHVIGEFATAGDWERFNDGAGLAEGSDALAVMEAARSQVPVVTVDNTANTVAPGGTLEFTASEAAVVGYSTNPFTWSVYDAAGNPLEDTNTSIDENGVLMVDSAAEEGTIYVVAAESTTNPGAVGLASVTVKMPIIEATDDISVPIYGLLMDDGSGAGTYKMAMVRSVAQPVAGASYEGETIEAVFSDFESTSGYFGWRDYEYADKITSITADSTYAPDTLKNAFNRLTAVKTIDLSKMDCSNVTNYSAMFDTCSALEEVTLPEGF